MGILFNTNRISVGLNPQIQLNNGNRVYFGNRNSDSFQNNSVEKLFDETMIKTLIFKNKELRQLLKDNNIPVRLNLSELEDLKLHHCKDTQDICSAIVKNLPQSVKQDVSIKDLKDGAMLHDFGKVLIPSEILNKAGSLTAEEHNIMDLHSQIGYELLKNSGVSQEVLKLVKDHHNVDSDINLQILNLADKYSALTEQRVYKPSMSPQAALTTIYADVQRGEIHPIIYNALVKAVSGESNTPNPFASAVFATRT